MYVSLVLYIIHKFCESSPILQALNICNIESIIERNFLDAL